MAEYIYREAFTEDIRLRHCKDCFGLRDELYCRACWVDDMLDEVDLAPAADVVEVVRCKDCVHSRPLCHTEKKLYNDDCIGCTKISTSYHSVIMSENAYCNYGVAKMDGKGEG